MGAGDIEVHRETETVSFLILSHFASLSIPTSFLTEPTRSCIRLRKTFLLVDAEHGLKKTDITLLGHLAEKGIAHQIVLSKVDKLLFPHAKPPSPQRLSTNLLHLRSVCEDIRQTLQPDSGRTARSSGDIICCSSEKEIQSLGLPRGKLGIDALRWAILSASGLDCDENGQKKKFETYTMENDGT